MPKHSLLMSIAGVRSCAVLVLLLFCLVGCAGLSGASVAASDRRAGDGYVMPAESGRLDVTNGLVANDTLVGSAFSDGSDGEVIARSENYFADTDGDGLPDDAAADATRAGSDFVDSDGDGLPDQRIGTGETVKPKARLLVYSGHVRVEVARAQDAARTFLVKVEQWGGYLQSQVGTALTVRIPAKHFDAAFAAVRVAGRVLSETRTASDVTEEFVDLGIRVDNARRSRQRLLEVLKLAKKVEDILRVEKELRRLTTEIERMEGRLKFLRDQVSMSTLRAEFQATAEAPPVKRQRRWSRFGWVNRVGASAVMEGF